MDYVNLSIFVLIFVHNRYGVDTSENFRSRLLNYQP